jgi:hypothetical protein
MRNERVAHRILPAVTRQGVERSGDVVNNLVLNQAKPTIVETA